MNISNLTNILYQWSRTAERTLISTTVSLNNLSSQMTAINQTGNNLEDKYNEMSNDIKYIINNLKENEYVWRSYDGTGNNIVNPLWGSANIPLGRKGQPDYADGKSSLATKGSNNPNPRVVSNSVCKINDIKNIPLNEFKLSDLVWVWGQFLEHEIYLTPDNSNDTAYITTETKEEDPNEEYPNRIIFFNRSKAVLNSHPREQCNIISSFIDASIVYGSSSDRAHELRKLDGSGKLKTSLADNNEVLLPYNIDNLSNASLPGQIPSNLFLAGDVRSNENVVLTAMHTLFVREHNRLCDIIVQNIPEWLYQEELIYQHARKIVGGIMQKITYNDFLPALLGHHMINSYNGYDKNINSSTQTEFSTAGYRLGHSMLSSHIQIGTNPNDFVLLKDAFFKPEYIQENGIEQLLLGSSKQKMKKINNEIIDDVRNFLFGPPTASHLLDLATLNIQRGRDHGIAGYNDVRESYGLLRKSNFSDITSNIELQTKLQALYISPNYIDPWVGALCEDHIVGAAVGELTSTILKEQFRKLRDGDRFWYENDQCIQKFELDIINNSTLSSVILRNTNISSSSLAEDVFHVSV